MATRWVPVDNATAKSVIGEGLHTGLRRGTDAPEAPALWNQIARSEQAWSDALAFLVSGLDCMGMALCKKEESDDEPEEPLEEWRQRIVKKLDDLGPLKPGI